MIQKCKFQKRNDPPICVISFLELTSLDHFFTQIGGSIWCFVLALCVTITTRWIITCLHRWSGKSWIICVMSEPSSPAPRAVHVSELVVRKIADHFARQGRGGGGFMGWVIHDPRIIWWGGRGGVLDPRGSVIRGPPTTLTIFSKNLPSPFSELLAPWDIPTGSSTIFLHAGRNRGVRLHCIDNNGPR